MKTICINCPLGCPIEVTESGGKILVRGNTCKRGHDYGVTEYLRPVRTVTTLVTREDGAVVSVKTSAPVPKDSIFELQSHIKTLRVPLAVKRGDTVERNALGLGADIVVTGVPPVAR